MTAVVTGAAGHIGGTLIRALLAADRATRAVVHRDHRALAGLPVDTVQADLDDPATLRRAFSGAETVYHTAAQISLRTNDWPLLHRTNVIGTRNVVAACQACGVRRLIHFSSIHALEQRPFEAPVDEDRPLVGTEPRDPHWVAPYDRSKSAGERIVREAIAAGLDAVILYPTAVIGPYDFRPSHVGATILALARGQMPALVQGGFDWVDVRDVAAAALRAETAAPPGSRYLLSGHWRSVVEVGAAVARVTGQPAPRFVSPLWLARIGMPLAAALGILDGNKAPFSSVSLHALESNRHISHERATHDLGYAPRPFEETISDAVAWLLAHERTRPARQTREGG